MEEERQKATWEEQSMQLWWSEQWGFYQRDSIEKMEEMEHFQAELRR
jgi:hypothetical protein